MTSPDQPSLDAARWSLASALFEEAVEQPDPERWLLEHATDDDVVNAIALDLLRGDAETSVLDRGVEYWIDPGLDGETAIHLEAGSRIGDFEIIEAMDEGGMGVLYRARDTRLDRDVALKFLLPGRSQLRSTDALIAEARTVAGLDHPNIATVYAVGETDAGVAFMAMALYRGQTLRERMDSGPFDVADVRSIAVQLARGLAAAHVAGIVHRDVKPENIFLTEDGLVKLLDFGIAANARSAGNDRPSGGTPRYVSPEQARGESPRPATDVWSAAVTVAEMLEGRPIMDGANKAELLRTIRMLTAPPELEGVAPAALRSVLRRALQPDPDERIPDGAALLRELEAFVDGRKRSAVLRRRGVVAAAMVAALATMVVFWQRGSAPRPTLAVLPFQDFTGDTTDAYLPFTLTRVIAARLQPVEGLDVKDAAVLGRSSDGTVDPVEAGRTLAVNYIVDGSVTRVADRIRVMARLIRISDGVQLWADEFTVFQTDLLALEAEAAGQIARSIGLRLAPGASAPGIPESADPVAYDHFLRGNYYLGIRSPGAAARADEEYGRALEIDPALHMAEVRRAYVLGLFADWGWAYPGRSSEELLDSASTMADRILATDSLLAEAWLTKAYITTLVDPVNMAGAPEAFERAIAIDPGNAESHHQYGQALMNLGRWDEALAAYHRALEIEPERAMTLVPIAAIHYRERRLQEALIWYDSAVAVSPNIPYPYAGRAATEIAAGDYDAALRDSDFALRLDPGFAVPPRSMRALALYHKGDTLLARQELRRALAAIAEPDRPSSTDVLYVGKAMAGMGDIEALEALIERARPRGANLWFVLQSPDFDAVRERPRVQAVATAAHTRDTGRSGTR